MAGVLQGSLKSMGREGAGARPLLTAQNAPVSSGLCMDARGDYKLKQSHESESQSLSGSRHTHFPEDTGWVGQCPATLSALFHACSVNPSALRAMHRGVSSTV